MLKKLRKWADSLIEYPHPDNANKLRPDYSFFYKKRISRFFRRLRYKFSTPIDSPKYFKELLSEVTQKRKTSGFHGNFIRKLSVSSESEFIVFGDLLGNFHSLVRDLEELNKMGLITEELQLLKPNHYLIFNGNVINSSPYNMEILTTAFLLLKQNPLQVFYIRGSHENEEEWHNYSLKQELMVGKKSNAEGLFPLNSEVNEFFTTLPLALYLRIASSEKVDIIKFSHVENINEANFAPYLLRNEEKATSVLPLKDLNFPKTPFSLKVFFQGIDRSISYRPTTGFEFVSIDHGTIIYSLFSAPTKLCQKLYGFYNDSFAIFKPQNWTLHHYTQDVRHFKGFTQEVYNLEEFGHAGLAKDKNTIVLGCTLDLSKASSFLGNRLKEGVSLGASECNHQGGVKGQFLSPIFLDDEYTPHKALQNVQEFIDLYKLDIIFSPLGTPTTEAFLPLVQEKKILVLFPYTGANIFRKPELDHILHLRPSYTTETEALIHYAYTQHCIKKFAIFYQDDAYGQAGLEGAKKAFNRHGVTHWLEISYLRNSPNIQAAASAIQDYNPESIIFISTYAPSVSLIHALTPALLHNKLLMGLSFLTDLFRDFLASKGLPFIISRVFPNAAKDDLEIVAKYQHAMKTYNQNANYTPDSFEGYCNTLLFTDILKSLTPPITKEKIIQHVSQYKNYPFYDLILNFDPNTHTLSHKVWLDTGDKDWIEFNALE